MPSHQETGGSGSGVSRKLAGAGVAAAALSGAAAGSESDGGWLPDISGFGADDAVGFVAVDVAALREHDDLLELGEGDLTGAWNDGDASLDDVTAAVDDRTDISVSDAKTVIDATSVTVDDVDQIAAVGSGAIGDDGGVGGLVIDGSVAVVAATEGRVLAGGTSGVDADGGDVIDLLIDVNDGEAARLGPESEYAGDIFAELSDVVGVAGVEWVHGDASADLLPDSLSGALKAQGYLPDGVDVQSATGGVGAVAVGVDPGEQRAKGVVAYDGSPPVEAVRDTVDHLEAQHEDTLADLDVSGSVDSTEENLLVLEASTTAEELRDLQRGLSERASVTTALGQGITRGAIPTLKGAYRTAVDYWRAFVENHL
ncbi:hypothetical protein BRD18_04185 [Halobacteriales archaeon SW_7_71_33]|nr:MAG: hypothetical protein BRD18_04185 [Halobacteriales archaeon SW_7_71_33]